jgi:hypothetical protein
MIDLYGLGYEVYYKKQIKGHDLQQHCELSYSAGNSPEIM